MPDDKPPTGEELFLQHQALIERVIAWVCRKHLVSQEDAEEFSSWVRLRLIDDCYAVLRKWEGRSSLKTFLTSTILNLFKDFRVHCWGRWRPSAEAKRLGRVAVRLKELLVKDGRTFDEACEILRVNEKVGLSWQELADLAARLPPKSPRLRPEGEEALQDRPADDPPADERLVSKELQGRRERLLAVLRSALALLPGLDRLLLKMRFGDGMQVSEIARALKLDQKPLYRRIEKALAELRRALEAEGFRGEELDELLRDPP